MKPISVKVKLLVVLTLVAASGVWLSRPGDAADCSTHGMPSRQLDKGMLNAADNEHTLRCTDVLMIIESNGIQSIPFEQTTPNHVVPRYLRFEIPQQPQKAGTPVRMPLLGPVAVAIDGLPFFGPNEAPPTYGDPIMDELLDSCNGHPNERGLYHYHALPSCLIQDRKHQAGVIVGYAFDGYPILSPYECVDHACGQVYEVKSSYIYVGGSNNAWQAHEYKVGEGHLDECNGMNRPDGTYAYYATTSFPYVISCYHGEPRQQMRGVRVSERRDQPPRRRIRGRAH